MRYWAYKTLLLQITWFPPHVNATTIHISNPLDTSGTTTGAPPSTTKQNSQLMALLQIGKPSSCANLTSETFLSYIPTLFVLSRIVDIGATGHIISFQTKQNKILAI